MDAPFQVVIDNIRFDKRISPMARFFYAEICANVTIKHGCRIDYDYFATLYGVTTRQVINWRNELLQFDYIEEITDKITKLKYLLPKGTIKDKMLKTQGLSLSRNISYKIKDGQILKSPSEAKIHFSAMINAQMFPEKVNTKLLYFLNTFLECIYDSSYFYKQYGAIKVTQEFFQFVIDNLTIDEIYSTAMYVFNEERYSDIRQPDYYILTCIANKYADEYYSKAVHIWKTMKRQEKNKEKQLDKEQKAKQHLWDCDDYRRKREIMKNANQILNQNKEHLGGNNGKRK